MPKIGLSSIYFLSGFIMLVEVVLLVYEANLYCPSGIISIAQSSINFGGSDG